jgi:hypothetical protein
MGRHKGGPTVALQARAGTALAFLLEAGGAAALATLGLRLAFAPRLRTLVVSAAPRLGQNAGLLYFAVELFQRYIERTVGIDNNLAHSGYQRDLPLPER